MNQYQKKNEQKYPLAVKNKQNNPKCPEYTYQRHSNRNDPALKVPLKMFLENSCPMNVLRESVYNLNEDGHNNKLKDCTYTPTIKLANIKNLWIVQKNNMMRR